MSPPDAEDNRIERIRDDGSEEAYRSASMNAALGIGAAGVVAPFVAPYVHDLIDKVIGPDDGPQVILPPGIEHEGD